MNDIVDKILARTTPLTRTDIADILASVGKRGEKRPEKTAAVKDVCDQKHTGTNADGQSIWNDLTDFPQW